MVCVDDCSNVDAHLDEGFLLSVDTGLGFLGSLQVLFLNLKPEALNPKGSSFQGDPASKSCLVEMRSCMAI